MAVQDEKTVAQVDCALKTTVQLNMMITWQPTQLFLHYHILQLFIGVRKIVSADDCPGA